MADCLHHTFKVEAKVARLTDSEESDIPTGFHMDLTVHCAECHKPFQFVGMPQGFSPGYPTTDFEGVEARIPIKPVI